MIPPEESPDRAVGRTQRPTFRPTVVRAQHYLHAGQIFVTDRPTEVTTIVGSCVAVCMWHDRSGAGGINHYLLADAPSPGAAEGRFGNLAIPALINRLVVELGASVNGMRAKVFGGATVMPGLTQKSLGGELGARNIERAVEILKANNIPVISSDVSGTRGRKIMFHTDTGAVWLKHL